MQENKFHITNNQHRYRYFRRPSPGEFLSKTRLFKKPKAYQVDGDIRLGYIYDTNMVFGILKKELCQHLLLVGRSGSGKTNTLRTVMIELGRLNIPFISFDTAKYGTRFLKYYMNNLIVLRWDKEFYFNPLQNPSGVGVKEWLLAFCEITTEVLGLRTASNLFLTDFIQCRLFRKFDTEKSGIYPTMHDLHHELEERGREKIPRNEREYINAIKGKIKSICNTLDKMIDVRQGIPIEELIKYPVCIELVGIKNSEIQYWIISLILAAIASYREARKMSFGDLRHVFIFDECAKIIGKGEQ